MKSFVALLLCLLVPTMAFAANDNGYKVSYDGGSLQNLKAGTNVWLVIDPDRVRIMHGKLEVANIPAASITEISYGQDVHRRVGAAIGLAVVSLGIGALMLLAKSKKHYVGLTWSDGDKKGGFAMQCDKNDYRGELAALEGITGIEGCRLRRDDRKELAPPMSHCAPNNKVMHNSGMRTSVTLEDDVYMHASDSRRHAVLRWVRRSAS